MSEPVLQDMMEVWTRKDRFSASCLHCPYPNAVEFALVGISSFDINRRGVHHHSEDDIAKLMAGVERLKQIYNIGERDREVFLGQPGPIDPQVEPVSPCRGQPTGNGTKYSSCKKSNA